VNDAPDHLDVDLEHFDFNIVYEGGELLPGLITDGVPWDIREAQPGVLEFERKGRFRGFVLDAGCGLADNAIYLASRGFKAAAFDASSTAIKLAKDRAQGADVEFFVANATSLAGHEGRFDTVLDSALYQVLAPPHKPLYLQALHRASKAGAWLNMLVFAAVPGGMPAPMSVPKEELETTLQAAGWRVTSIDQSSYSGVASSMSVFVERFGVKTTADERNQIHVPVWTVEAERV
jgi:SAM-dependent methyltransferase